MIGTDGDVTPEEEATLRSHKDGEFFRIARKALGQNWRYNAMRITKCDVNHLQFHQGVMAGLEAAYNILNAIVLKEELKAKAKKPGLL